MTTSFRIVTEAKQLSLEDITRPEKPAEGLSPPQDLKALIRQEHIRGELLRLRAGYDGCGCADCQQFYTTLDLAKYGGRVRHNAGIISIEAGKNGADLYEQYNKQDYWAPEGFFVTGGKKYGVSPTGGTICLGDAVTAVAKQAVPRVKVVAGSDGVIFISGKDATALFRDAVSRKLTAYRLTKQLKEQGIAVSCRTVGRLLAKLQGILAQQI